MYEKRRSGMRGGRVKRWGWALLSTLWLAGVGTWMVRRFPTEAPAGNPLSFASDADRSGAETPTADKTTAEDWRSCEAQARAAAEPVLALRGCREDALEAAGEDMERFEALLAVADAEMAEELLADQARVLAGGLAAAIGPLGLGWAFMRHRAGRRAPMETMRHSPAGRPMPPEG